MRYILHALIGCLTTAAAETHIPTPPDPGQVLERTCFQTGAGYSDRANLRSDVAIVYGIDPGLPQRIQSWRDRGYRIHVMTGVSWGNYQDYLYGRFDGTNHEDEAQTDRHGKKVSHGGDVYYMCPGEHYGRFLCVGVQRALDAGAEAIHLEEPEFWVRSGYSEGFKREWKKHYAEDWQPPHSSVEAQWRASKLKYFLYRHALQQVFAYVQDHNRRTGRQVRCYVPTHSLLNYAHWRIVSPESSLAQLDGCDGYIAQVWTGTARSANRYRGQIRERTFETAFLEYGVMQNLVRATQRRVWYLNDPVEDNPDHNWEDYRVNWESTLVASLLQPEVWQFEVMPWPERVFNGRYPRKERPEERESMPPAYATEVQTVINALNDLNQPKIAWDCGTPGIGLLVSDSLMFQRGEPEPGDPHLSRVYGLALPLVKRGIPVAPVQLENAPLTNSLDPFKLLVLSYHGMKPLAPDVHPPLARWVRAGGVLVVWDDDSDPYNRVREWWNTNAATPRFVTPREHLFAELGLPATPAANPDRAIDFTAPVGRGRVVWHRGDPAAVAASPEADHQYIACLKSAAVQRDLPWRESNRLLLRRGPYVIAAGLDESIDQPALELRGRFVNLFDPDLALRETVVITPGSRWFLLDLDRAGTSTNSPGVLAAACKTWPGPADPMAFRCQVEGVAKTPAVLLLRVPRLPATITLDGHPLVPTRHDPVHNLLWLRFPNEPRPRPIELTF